MNSGLVEIPESGNTNLSANPKLHKILSVSDIEGVFFLLIVRDNISILRLKSLLINQLQLSIEIGKIKLTYRF